MKAGCLPAQGFGGQKGGLTLFQGPRSKFLSGGAKEECVKENLEGCMLVDFYSISLK